MPDRRRGVLSLTMGLVITLLFSTGAGYLATGGEHGVRQRSASHGLFAPTVPMTPQFGPPAPVLPTDAPGGAAATEQGITQALAPLVTGPRLAGKVAVSVTDVESGEALYGLRATDMVTPASTTKIVTAAAALAALGPYHRFTTKVVTGSTAGEIVLVGGGDPTLSIGVKGSYPGVTRLDTLAKQVKAAAGGEPISRVVVDSTLFTGPDRGTGWDAAIVREGFVAPVSALTVNGGRTAPTAASARPAARTNTPDLFAGQAFARLLGLPKSAVTRGAAPAGARELAKVASPPVQHLVELMLQLSDNVIAESLQRQVAVAKNQPATFEGSAEAVRGILKELGLDPAADALLDGSGLSRLNRLTPELLTGVLEAAASPDHPRLRGLFAGLPVAAYSGTLAKRFGGPAASSGAGEVRAKTGSLSGVSALAGVVVADNGRQLAFAAVANGFPGNGGEAVASSLDRIAAALAGCGCA